MLGKTVVRLQFCEISYLAGESGCGWSTIVDLYNIRHNKRCGAIDFISSFRHLVTMQEAPGMLRGGTIQWVLLKGGLDWKMECKTEWKMEKLY